MQARHWIVVGLAFVLLLVTPGVAAAAGSPRLLAHNASSQFVRRPAALTPYGNGAAISTIIGRTSATGGKPIRWRTWGLRSARGAGTMWENDMTPSIAEGNWHGHAVKLYAYRVVNRRFTRLMLLDQVDGQPRTRRLGLLRLNGMGFAWRTLVTAPSWRNFPGSYTGDDFFAGLEAMKAAIESGFERAGLVADVAFINGIDGARASQRPKPGTRLPQGATVHIRIPVID